MKTKPFKEIRSLLSYLKPYRKQTLYALISLFFSSGATLMLSQGIRSVIDGGISSGNENLLVSSVLKSFLIVLVLGLATAFRFFFITYVGEKVTADIRRKINDKILTLSPSFFEINKAGDLLSQLSGDTTTIYNIISSSLSVMTRNIVTLTGGLILLISTSLKLTAIIALTIPILVLIVIFMGRSTKQLSRKSQDKVAELTSITDEIIHNIKTIQAYANEDFERNKFEAKLSELITVSLERISSRSILTFALIVGVFSTVGIVLWIGSADVINGLISAGQLSSFLFLTIICGISMVSLSETMNNIQKASGVSERISEFLNKESDIQNCVGALKISEITTFNNTVTEEISPKSDDSEHILFQNVTFAYPSKPQTPVLKDLSIIFPKGKTTALVGESGAGKSTIFQLLLRFYDINSGSILYHDVETSKIDLHDLRREFAYVSQDVSIFSASIYDNIIYSDPTASKKRVHMAAEIAAATEFIDKLPDGFDTFVGEKGVRLSGGQKQRIAIARAILKNPNILLLDEATSSLDTSNELLVQKGLNNLIKNRTCIVIAHRLSTIQNADNIVVIRDGQVCEQGKHDELLAKNGYYALLHASGGYKH